MKWTREYVWEKVESIIPNAKVAFGSDLPSALNKAAVELFLLDEGMHNGSWRAYVVETGIKELRSNGFLEFGQVDQDWQ